MASIRVAIDEIQGSSADLKTLEQFAQKLRAKGHTVTTHGRGPNKIQGVMQSKSNQCDLMIQIAGGKCLGTLCDFHLNLNTGYYKAKAGGFAYFKCWDANWKSYRAGDDNFSKRNATIRNEVNSKIGKTLPEIYASYDNMYYGYGDTADELANTFLANYTGKSSTGTGTGENSGGGKSLLDIVKELVSDWDKYGVEVTMNGNTVNIKKTNPNNAIPLTEHMLINNSVSFTDYDSNTPNTYKNTKDKFLINKFGSIPVEDDVDSSWEEPVLLMAQRGHGHSIDCKCVVDPRLVAGEWVSLTLPRYNIYDRKYHITKWNYSDERNAGLTLESGPPSRFVEVVEETTEEDVSADTGEDT